MTECIAERKLLYSMRGSDERKELAIRVFAPFPVQEGTVNFRVDDGATGCFWEFHGLPEKVSDTSYGADSVQALQLAIDIDGKFGALRRKYDFYFPSGEPYFEN